LNRVLGTCTRLYALVAVMALLVGLVLVPVFDALFGAQIADYSEERRADALIATGIVAFNTALSFATRLPFGVLAAYQRFFASNLMMMGSTACRVLLIYFVLTHSASFAHLAIVEGIIILLDFVLPFFYIRRTIPEARFSFRVFDRGLMKDILVFGGFVLLLQMGIRLSFMLDAQVIGANLPHRNVAYYNSANTFLLYLTELMVSLGQVVMPAAARLSSQGQTADLKPILLKWSKIALSLSLLVCLYLLAFGPEFIGVWMHDAAYIEPSRGVLPILIVSCIAFLPIRAVALPMLMGLGLVKQPAITFLAAGLLNLGISLALVGPYGLVGVALGTAIPNVLYALAMARVATRAIGMDTGAWLLSIGLKPMLGSALVFPALYGLSQILTVDSIPTVLLSGILSTLVFSLVWVLFVYRGDPHFDLAAMVRRRMHR
ncbi:MAG TPA: polysaccharide biosynthesis C-terminal domain-containing protein, partial [Planctomycetota bacterium]|nr:polysaccharide biosynthesis C-terminal domain-containing protein [Planctomycetota bacterium]